MSVLVLGHRGLGGHPEPGSVEAVFAAIDAGCDGVEVDVRQTADGALALTHDPIHHGLLVSDHSLMRLREAGSLDTLEELVAAVGEAFLDVEVKAPVVDEARLVASLTDTLGGRPATRTMVSSFYLPALAAIASTGLTIGVLTATAWDPDGSVAVSTAASVGGRFALPHHESLHDGMALRLADENGLGVITWTVNDPDRAMTLEAWGAVGIITDDPGPVLTALGRM